MSPRPSCSRPAPARPTTPGSACPAQRAPADLPILGVCLGHQAIGQALRRRVIRAKGLMHGKTSPIDTRRRACSAAAHAVHGHPLSFARGGTRNPAAESGGDRLDRRRRDHGLQHRDRPVHGVQFHPESIATEHGHALLANFLNLAGVKRLAAVSACLGHVGRLQPLLARLADGATLTEADADAFFAACLRGEPTPAQIAAAVTAMRLRGETVGEITASARAMRAAAARLEHPYQVIDTCGTGGTDCIP